MFIKNRLSKLIVAMVCSFALTFTPANSSALSMNDPLIKAVTQIVISLAAYYAVDKIMTKMCSPQTPIFCVESVFAKVAIGVVIGYGLSILLSSRDKSKCEGSECYREGTPTTTLDPSGGSTPTTTLAINPDPSPPNSGITPERILDVAGIDLVKAQEANQKGLVDLEQKGYSYDEKSGVLTTPMGKVTAESMSSAAGMKSAGFPESAIQQLEEARDQAKSEGDTASRKLAGKLGMDEGDSNAAYPFGGAGGLQAAKSKFNLENYNKKKADLKSSVSGLAKSDGNGGLIGVGVGNMFETIHREYENQRQNKQFVEKP